MSPELVKVKLNNKKIKINQIKSELFSIGLIILTAIT
jgi:hypothetical protein